MANTPGNTGFDCACDLIWCQAVIRSLLVLPNLGAVSLSCPWFVISLQHQLHLCFVQCWPSAADIYAVWFGVLVWLWSESPRLSPVGLDHRAVLVHADYILSRGNQTTFRWVLTVCPLLKCSKQQVGHTITKSSSVD